MPQRRSKKIQVDGITCKNCGKVFDMSKFDDAFAHAKTHLKDNKTKSVDKLKALLIKKQFKVGGKRKMGERRTIDFLEEPGEPATHPKDRRDPRREGEGTNPWTDYRTEDQRIPPSRVGFHPEGMHEMNSSDSSDLARKLTQGGNKGYTLPTGQKTGNKEQVQAMATLGHRNAFDNKSIDKLKALLNKGKFGKDIKDIRLIQDKCTHCGKKLSGDVSASIGSKEYREGRQCKNCKKQEKKDYDTVSHYFDLTNDPEYQRQREEYLERRSRGENVGNFKFKKPRKKR